MVGMPDWFAKTREMVAADLYFSVAGAGSETALITHYDQALQKLAGAPTDYPKNAQALSGYSWAAPAVDQHFVGDWIHYRYYQNTAVFGNHGGDFWPTIPSSEVINKLRAGVQIAIHKALGQAELMNRGIVSPKYHHDLWWQELANGVDINGVRPLAMSWNCVAPAGSNYFQVAALRGPSVVEFAIATPKPYGYSSMMRAAIRIIDEYYRYDDPDDIYTDTDPQS